MATNTKLKKRNRKNKQVAASRVCPNHGCALELQNTQYGRRYFCPNLECTVACWSGPTSTPADYETRQARMQAHDLFDPLWVQGDPQGLFGGEDYPELSKNKRRGVAYSWLKDAMGTEPQGTHIGAFSAEQCQKLIHVITNKKAGE